MPGLYLRKYATVLSAGAAGSDTIRASFRKIGMSTFATSADWTLAVGDFKVRTDAGSEANITNLPTWNGTDVVIVLSAAELTGKRVRIIVANAAVESDDFTVETFGHASGQYKTDFTDLPNVRDAARIKYGAPGTAEVRYVSVVGGDDMSGDGTISRPFATQQAARAASVAGDLVVSGRGVWSWGNNNVSLTGGVHFLGQGIDKTVINSTATLASNGGIGPIIQPGSGSDIGGFTVIGTKTLEAYCAPIGLEAGIATNVVLHDIRTDAWSDGLFWKNSNATMRHWYENLYLSAGFDTVNFLPTGGGTYDVDAVNLNCYVQQFSGSNNGGVLQGRAFNANRPGTYRLHGGSFVSLSADDGTTEMSARGIGAGASTGPVYVLLAGAKIVTRSTSSASDISISSAGAAIVTGASFDRNKATVAPGLYFANSNTPSQLDDASTAGKQAVADAGLLAPTPGTAASGSNIDYAAKTLKVAQAGKAR